ncbi:MAG: hypothetical protein VW954_06505 [Alphaproteobacteria bacterium]|jgi:hypothetical protein|tara:strand:- start:156 stop:572 length:417 start_codon:yes stop_codon:yes gene_type:complete
MKLVDSKKDNWKEINKIVLLVNTVDFDYSEKLTVNLNCNFENISKGRCSVRINEKKNKKTNSLSVLSNQALMMVNIFYEYQEIEKLVNFIILNKNNNKKIKGFLEISDNLMVNDSGYLYVNNEMEIKIKSISWNIPII